MIKIEHDYTTPIEYNYYQNVSSNLYLQEPSKNQNYTNYTPIIIEKNSSMINIYQKRTNKKSAPKEKNWTIPVLLESAKKKHFHPPDLEKKFLIDSGVESNNTNTPT